MPSRHRDIRGRVLRLAKIHQRWTPPFFVQMVHHINSSPVFIQVGRNRSRLPYYDVPSTRGSTVFYSKDFAWEKSRQEQEKLQNPTEEQRKKLAADAARKERLKRRRCEE